MSRYELAPKPNKAIISVGPSRAGVWPEGPEDQTLGLRFGFDNVLGIWFDVTCADPNNPETVLDEPVKEFFSTRFNQISKSHLLEAVAYYASASEKKELEEVLLKCALDLPF